MGSNAFKMGIMDSNHATADDVNYETQTTGEIHPSVVIHRPAQRP